MTVSTSSKLLAAALLLAAAAPRARAAEDAAEAAAVKAASDWVARVDAGRYAESWTEASAFFRGSLSKEQWVEAVGAARKPLGPLVERKVKSRARATTLPGAPDGEYVVVQYQTSFAQKKAAIETVTAMREKDGGWRVAGYFVR